MVYVSYCKFSLNIESKGMKEWTKGYDFPLGLRWGVLSSGRESMRLLLHISHVRF